MNLPGGGRLSLREFVRRLIHEFDENGVGDSAAQVSYYLFFSLFPFLLFLATLAAYLPLGRASRELTARLAEVLPGNAATLVEEYVSSFLTKPRPNALTVALLGTFWSASRGVDAVRIALNRAYGVRETRPYWRTQVNALGLTAAGAILMLTSVSILLIGGDMGVRLARWVGIEWGYHRLAGWLRWPLTAFVVMWVAALAYYLLPDVEQKFRYITPGSVVGTLLWLAATWGFTFYTSHFGTYDVAYGSLGGVIVLLTWFLISATAFLLGGTINAILEHASIEGKDKGEHVEGEHDRGRRKLKDPRPPGSYPRPTGPQHPDARR